MNLLFYMKLAARNIRKNSQTYVPYILTCIGSVLLFNILYTMAFNEELNQIPGGNDIRTILYLGCFVIGLFSAVFLFYTNSFLMKRRKKEIGLFNILGMGKRHLGIIMFFETAYLACISLTAGIGGGLLFSKAVYLLLLRLVRQQVQWGVHFSGKAAAATLLLFSGIFLAILAVNLCQVQLSSPMGLMRGSQTGEKEPKTKRLLTLTGVLSLGAAYYMALTVQSPYQVISVFFVAVILVIIGTYCLFTAGSVAILKYLKKKRRYYYRTEHFIAVSGLLYRMKQNAAGLAGICILFTSVLVMLSSTVSLYAGIDDVMNNRFPREMSFWAPQVSAEKEKEIDQAVKEVLESRGLSEQEAMRYRELSLAALLEEGENGLSVNPVEGIGDYDAMRYLYFITDEDYCRLTGEQVELDRDEVMVIRQKGTYEEDSLTVFGKTYRNVPAGEHMLWEDADTLGDEVTYYVLVSGMDELRSVYEKQAEMSGYGVSDIDYHLAFNLEADPETEALVYQEICERLGALIPGLRAESELVERDSYFSFYAGLLFLGIFLGTLFLMAAALIIYYKQVTEGYDDKERYEIMQKVGLSKTEIRASIRSQILLMFFLPPAAAAVHIFFAFPMITKLLSAMNLTNVTLFAWCTAGTFAVFAAAYCAVYLLTSKVYMKIVS